MILPIGPKVVPFWGSYLEFYKVIPKRNYFGAYSLLILLPIGPKVVPFWGSYVEFYKVIPKRNYFGAYG